MTLKCNVIAAAILALMVSPAIANDEHQHDQKSAPAAEAGPQVEKPAADSKSMAMMDAMKKMQEQMEKLRTSNDPKEREKLLMEHMQTMQDAMGSMRGMGGGMMAGPAGGGPGQGDMRGGQANLEQRMDMMQMMMEKMMQHQKTLEGTSK
jgi:hypothetical protein